MKLKLFLHILSRELINTIETHDDAKKIAIILNATARMVSITIIFVNTDFGSLTEHCNFMCTVHMTNPHKREQVIFQKLLIESSLEVIETKRVLFNQ